MLHTTIKIISPILAVRQWKEFCNISLFTLFTIFFVATTCNNYQNILMFIHLLAVAEHTRIKIIFMFFPWVVCGGRGWGQRIDFDAGVGAGSRFEVYFWFNFSSLYWQTRWCWHTKANLTPAERGKTYFDFVIDHSFFDMEF